MGLFDVDAMTVSMTRLVPQLHDRLAAFAILAGVASNTLSKVIIAAVIAPRVFATRVAVGSLVSIVAGVAALIAVLASRAG